jgi:thioredoxin-like negative regulator of GroEL
MLTHRLLHICVIAGIATIVEYGTSVTAADPANSQPSVKAVPQKPAVSTAKRPLTAAEVWSSDYAQARHRAKKLNRPLLLHFHATWCGPCRQMERDVLNSEKVLNELKAQCVAVKIDCDQQPTVAQQFGVESLPCDIVVTPDGMMQRLNSGFMPADEYTSLISTFGKAPSATPIQVSSN